MEQAGSEKFDIWGIVEVMGHRKFAGRVTEQTIAGSALVRIDVPTVTLQEFNGVERVIGAFSKLVGVGSIYCITPTTEEVARKCAKALASQTDVLPVYIPQERQLAASVSPPDDDDSGDLPY